MKLRKRKLNSHETYACSSKDVKSIFGNENVFISFGFLSRGFSFDYSDRKRPRIDGTIIASASINKRDNMNPDNECFICFYVIKDLEYNAKNKKAFTETYLPLLYQWYQEMLVRPETSLSGVEKFLVEWSHDDFKVHCYRYH